MLGRSDHPRTRGVYIIDDVNKTTEKGSSPHTRGLPRSPPAPYRARRIIPAHAGFTVSPAAAQVRRPDHPRTRGVYDLVTVGYLYLPGSSPHTRGLPAACGGGEDVLGIIPAHAGFTTYWKCLEVNCTDHPRTRGVYVFRGLFPAVARGSSPHTRGLPFHLHVQAVAARIIPAHAGFTEMTAKVLRPPIIRRRRIIPAHAGFTRPRSSRTTASSDHPRTRGVYGSRSMGSRTRTGSSPHTRGLQPALQRAGERGRIIPAHAGFTSLRL